MKMFVEKSVLEQALEALETGGWNMTTRAITNLCAALAQQDEPVAVHQFRKQCCAAWYDGHPDHTDWGGPYEERTLYTAPPQRLPLTEEEIDRITRAAARAAIKAVEETK